MRFAGRLICVLLLAWCATADGATFSPWYTRLGRWLGYGWSDGYQADAWRPAYWPAPTYFHTPVAQPGQFGPGPQMAMPQAASPMGIRYADPPVQFPPRDNTAAGRFDFAP